MKAKTLKSLDLDPKRSENVISFKIENNIFEKQDIHLESLKREMELTKFISSLTEVIKKNKRESEKLKKK